MKLWNEYRNFVMKYPGPLLMLMSFVMFFMSIAVLNAYITDTLFLDFMKPLAIPYIIFGFVWGVLCLIQSFAYTDKPKGGI